MEAISYCRYSPRPDEDISDANEKQRVLVKEWCDRGGYTLAGEFSDKAKSRDDLDRPGLWDAVDACRGRTLVVYSLDRIGDAVAVELVLRALRKQRSQLATVVSGVEEDDPTRQLVRTILGAIAVYQKQISAARTRSVMRRRSAAGDKMGGNAPAGKMLDPENPKRWIDCPSEQELIAQIVRLAQGGKKSARIATLLAKQEMQFRGHPVYRSLIEKIMARTVARNPAPRIAPDRMDPQSSTA